MRQRNPFKPTDLKTPIVEKTANKSRFKLPQAGKNIAETQLLSSDMTLANTKASPLISPHIFSTSNDQEKISKGHSIQPSSMREQSTNQYPNEAVAKLAYKYGNDFKIPELPPILQD